MKKKTVQNIYLNFVTDLKASNPAKWYSMAKRLGAEQNHSGGDLEVECLQGLEDQQSAEEIALFFSRISQEYAILTFPAGGWRVVGGIGTKASPSI